MIAAEHSRTIEAFRFPLAFCVIMIHASGTEILYSDGSLSAPVFSNCIAFIYAISACIEAYFRAKGIDMFMVGEMNIPWNVLSMVYRRKTDSD